MEGFANADYYSAVAQVIPVLFVLVAFEARIVRMDEWESGDPIRLLVAAVLVSSGLMASAILGEAAALRVLMERSELAGGDFLIVSTLIAATVTLFVVPMIEALYRLPREQRKRPAGEAARWTLLTLLFGATVGAPLASLVVLAFVVL